MHLTVACDVAQAIASSCVHASPLPGGPTVAQYSGQVSHAARNLIGSFLDNGPLFWLGLIVVLWVLGKVFTAIGSGLLLLMFGPKQRRSR
jgi:hypothetical protein